MADISREQQAWKNAVYGEDVRDAEIALNDKMNKEVEAGTARVEEYGRKEAERNAAENKRVAAENTRKQNETTRANTETTRANAEAERVKAETGRISTEEGRVAAEGTRVQNETSRTKAETARVNAESSRAIAETARVNAEKGRVAEFNSLKSASETATADAKSAAKNADTKATLANTAATSANTAADRANAAAESAEDVVAGTGLIPTAQKGAANGVATLDANKKVPYEQLKNADKTLVGLGNVPNVPTNDQVPTFTQSGSRANINSGEKLSVIFGKIKKWFADMRGAAFCDVANNQTTTEEGHVLDARQGAAISTTISDLSNRVDTQNSTLTELSHSLDEVSKRPITGSEVLGSALYIDTTNVYSPLNMKTWSLYSELGTTGMPPGCILGVREFYCFNANWYIIKVTEFHPMLGRTWYNRYDKVANVWVGWRSVASV